jgi:Arc/MetJ-type ribon-helix-helix transcriptional regulator
MTESVVAALDELVVRGRFASRSDALRTGLARIVREEREREISDAYRRDYTKHPQPDWIGEAGLASSQPSSPRSPAIRSESDLCLGGGLCPPPLTDLPS